MAFIVRAYNATYGAAFDGERLSRSMRLVPIRTGQALATMGLVHALMDEGPVLPPMPSLRWALKAAYGTGVLRSHALAYLTPVQPAPWLLVAIAEIMEVHAEQCAGAVFDGGAAIEDRNLDTGKLLRTQIRHPGTRNALAALATMLEETRALLHPGVGEVASVDAETLLALPGAGAPHPEAEPARVAVGRLEA